MHRTKHQTLISVKYILLGKNVHQSRAGKFESGKRSLRVGREVWEWAGKFESGWESSRVGRRVWKWEYVWYVKWSLRVGCEGWCRLITKQRKPVFVVCSCFFCFLFFLFLFFFTNCRMDNTCDRLQENRVQRGPYQKNFFFCTLHSSASIILSSPSFKAIASTSWYMHPNWSLLLAYLIHFKLNRSFPDVLRALCCAQFSYRPSHLMI